MSGTPASWAERAHLDVAERSEVFSVHLPVRWSDLDAQGHVNNAVFLDYLQDARIDFLLAGAVPEMMEEGVLAVDHQIEYRAPIPWTSRPVEVRIAILERGHARFRVGYLVIHDDVLCAVATSTFVPYDLGRGRPRRLTPAEVAHFDRYRWSIRTPFRALPRPALDPDAGERVRVMPVQTRWSDVDRFGHVNNVKMLDFFQEARIHLTASLAGTARLAGTEHPVHADEGGAPDGDAARSLWLMARQDIEYLRQMSFRREPYEIWSAITRIGRSSVTSAARLVDPQTGTTLARAAHVLVHADARARPVPIDDQSRALLEPLMVRAPGS